MQSAGLLASYTETEIETIKENGGRKSHKWSPGQESVPKQTKLNYVYIILNNRHVLKGIDFLNQVLSAVRRVL